MSAPVIRLDAAAYRAVLSGYREHSTALVLSRVRLASGLYVSAGSLLAVIDGPPLSRSFDRGVHLPYVTAVFYLALLAAILLPASVLRRTTQGTTNGVMAWWIALLLFCLTYFTLTWADISLAAFWVIGSCTTAALIFPWAWGRQLGIAVASGVTYLAYATIVPAVDGGLPSVYPITAVLLLSTYSVIGAASVDRIRFRVFLQREMLNRQVAELTALRRREQLAVIGEAAASTLHEVKRIHGTIAMFADGLGALGNSDAVIDTSGKIRACVDEARRVVAELMECGSARDVWLRQCIVRDVLRGCIASCALRAGPKRVDVLLHDSSAPMYWSLDEFRISRAIRNIIENAIDASHEGDRVDVAVRTDAGDLVIEVRDYGEGLSDEIAAQMLTLFVTSKPDGLGLGLPLSSAIIEAHDGSLSWERKSPGTCFTLRIPPSRNTPAGEGMPSPSRGDSLDGRAAL